MNFHVLTIFPEFLASLNRFGVVARAMEAGRVSIEAHDLRNWTQDRHRTVDDRPFGGGEGMVLKPEPLFDAVEAIFPVRTPAHHVVLLSAQGPRFTQRTAERLAAYDQLLLICGRYEGVDERVAEHLADEEISIGDFVLSGGELAAATVIDAVARLVPGVVGNEQSTEHESFAGDDEFGALLDCPHFTRPAVFRGWAVPEVLLSGDHERIRRWRRQAALEKTVRQRPDLLKSSAAFAEANTL